MRPLLKTAFIGLLLASVSAALAAKNRNWQEAKVFKITSDRAGTHPVPIGGTIVAVAVSLTRAYYWVETKDVIYVLRPALSERQQLDMTLYGKTKIAIEGRDAHVLNDQGRDREMHIVEKITRQNKSGGEPQNWD